jgi:dihydrofolate synthase/folylpolyglutamate synthase
MAAIDPRTASERVFPGEPGVTTALAPPFVAENDSTRWLFGLNRFGIRPGLRRIRALLAELGHPERDVPALVVAGTNGKGSTTRMLAALLQAAGYRTACFTSPHLLQITERISIDDRPYPADCFAEHIDRLRPAIEKHDASWFESLTALALLICREEGVDFLSCEVGLGGRLDATNALQAAATLLTSVSLDHEEILGDTLPAIAAEKLGLLKPSVPLFAAVAASLKTQVFETAVGMGSPCYFLDELVRWRREPEGWRLITRRSELTGLPPLESPVLLRNLALAWLAVEELAARGRLRLPPDPARALREVHLPGRFQAVLQRPDWILDTAHNTEALTACLEAFLARPCRGRRYVLFGCMRDKRLGSPVGRTLRLCDAVVAAPIALPRSRNSAELSELLTAWDLPAGERAIVADSTRAAISHLARMLTADDSVLVTGSCFLVAETLYVFGIRDLDELRAVRAAAEVLGPFAG